MSQDLVCVAHRCPVAGLPAEFGPWSSSTPGFGAGARGLWARLLAELGAELTARFVAWTVPHQDPSGRGQSSRWASGQAMGQPRVASIQARRGGHRSVAPVGLSLAPDNNTTCTPVRRSLPFGRQMGARDKGSIRLSSDRPGPYGSDGLHSPSVPSHPILLQPTVYRHAYRRELFCRIKRNRRVATRYEKLAVTFLGFVYLAQ